MQFQSTSSQRRTHRLGNLRMPLQDGAVCLNILKSGPQSPNITDGHGIRKPLLFKIPVKGHQIRVKGSYRRFPLLHSCPCSRADSHKGQSRRGGNHLLRAAAEQINLKIIYTNLFAKHGGDRIYDSQNAIGFQQRTNPSNIIEHAAGGITVNHCSILKSMILLQKICQCIHIDRFQIIHRIQHRISAVHFYKVGKALAEDAIVDDQHPIARLGETGAGRFQAKDALTAQNQRLVLCAKQGADELAGLLIERIKVRIQIRIGTGQASGCQHIFPDLCRSGCHNFVHGKLSFLN